MATQLRDLGTFNDDRGHLAAKVINAPTVIRETFNGETHLQVGLLLPFLLHCIISPLEGRHQKSSERRITIPGRRDSVLSSLWLACTLLAGLQDDVRKELAEKARLLQSGLMGVACT